MLLNEPIPGQGVFWSSVSGRAYPLSLRVLSFEEMFSVRDPDYNGAACDTYAQKLKERFDQMVAQMSDLRSVLDTAELVITARQAAAADNQEDAGEALDEADIDGPHDILAEIEQTAFEALRKNQKLMGWIQGANGAVWMEVQNFIKEILPEMLDNRSDFSYQMVPKAMNAIFGPQNEKWHTVRKEWYGRERTFLKAGPALDHDAGEEDPSTSGSATAVEANAS